MQFAIGDANNAAARGEHSPVDIHGSVLATCCPDIPCFTANGHAKCVAMRMLEGIYARICGLKADAQLEHFGPSTLDLAHINNIEQILRQLATTSQFSLDVTSLPCFVMRLTNLPRNNAFDVGMANLIDNEAHNAAAAHAIWCDTINLKDLVDERGLLGPYADLALLVGSRNLAQSRLLAAPPPRYASAMVLLLTNVREHDAMEPDNQVPGQGVFLPIPADQAELLEGVGSYLAASALPLELFDLLDSPRDARVELRLRGLYATGKTSEVIRQRFANMISCFKGLNRVLRDNTVPTQLEYASMLADKLIETKLDSVAAYARLEREVNKFTYTLDVGAGDAALTIGDRVLSIINGFEQSESRASSAGAAAPAGASRGRGQSFDPLDATPAGSGAACFSSMNKEAMNRYINLHMAPLLAKLNTVEPDFTDSPLASRDASRIIRAGFQLRSLPLWQFLLRPDSKFTADIFTQLDPYRAGLAKFLGETAVYDFTTGDIPERGGDYELNAHFQKGFLDLKWDELDWYNGLVLHVMQAKDASAVLTHLRWPHEVFSDANAVRLVKEMGDKLFAAIGYKAKSSSGFWGKVGKIQKFLDDDCPSNCHPSTKLFKVFRGIMKGARIYAQSAMRAGPDFPFPEFGPVYDTWCETLKLLTKAANEYRGRSDLEPEETSRHSSGKTRVSFGDDRRSSPARSDRSAGSGDSYGYDISNSVLPHATVDKPMGRHSSSSSGRSSAGQQRGGLSRGSTPISVGSRASDVFLDAATLRITFGRPDGTSRRVTVQWQVKDIKKVLKKTEGTDAKCLACAVVRAPIRHAYCNQAGAPGHESDKSAMHSFTGEPWSQLPGTRL